jgi:hypothetical protein
MFYIIECVDSSIIVVSEDKLEEAKSDLKSQGMEYDIQSANYTLIENRQRVKRYS